MSRSRTLLVVIVLALAVALGAAVLAACGGAGGAASSPSPAADPVVLHVDGHAIHQSAVDAVRAEFRLGGTADTQARAEKEVVRRELVRLEAERLGVTADPREVASRRAAMVAQLGGEQALAAALVKVPMTDAQLRSGLTDGVLREALQDAKYQGSGDLGRRGARVLRRAPYVVPRAGVGSRVGHPGGGREDRRKALAAACGRVIRSMRSRTSSPPTPRPRRRAETWAPWRCRPCRRL